MNTSDLRYQKTERLLYDTYCSMIRTGKPVRVGDLCEKARINKSTFYKHYPDLAALEKAVQKRVITKKLEETPHIHEAFTDTWLFCRALIHSISVSKKELDPLFHQDGQAICEACEEVLIDWYCRKEHRPRREEIKIRFIIGGACHVMMDPDFGEEDYLLELIGDLMSREEKQHEK